MKTLFALLAAAAFILLCMGGCTVICNSRISHVHNGDTDVAVDADAKLGTNSAMPVPSLTMPNPEIPTP